MKNWGDADTFPLDSVMGDGGIGFYPPNGPKAGLAYPLAGDNSDWYAFALRGPGENPYPQRPTQKYQPIIMADPSVLRVTWQGEIWYFVTGTSGAPDTKTRLSGNITVDSNQDELGLLGTQLANFVIYRTKDFYHFEPHMLAFNEFTPGQPTGPRRSNTVLHVGGDRKFTGLQSPCLYLDPTRPEEVFLVFTAVEYQAGETAPDYAVDEAGWRHNLFNNTSVFMSKMSLADFMNWKCYNWYTFPGPRFTFGPAWYNYSYGGFYRADGGALAGHPVPSSGPPQQYDGAGPLMFRECLDPLADRQDPMGIGRGWGHKVWDGTQYRSSTWMSEGGYVFVDSKPGAVPDKWMLYDWNDGKGYSGSVPGDLNPKTTNVNWGNSVAAHPLANGGDAYLFDPSYTTMFVANNRSAHNRISDPLYFDVLNGRANGYGLNWWWGGIAESSCAFYSPSTNCYYLLFSRNGASTAAYQIVYRRTNPGDSFQALGIASSTDFSKLETVLLRSLYFDWTDAFHTGAVPPASYGSPTYFDMLGADGTAMPYIAFHARLEGSQRRTVFFKELTFSGNDLLQLREQRDGAPTKQTSIDYFRIPWCRPGSCPGDVTGDGIVDFSDYTEFLNLYEAGDRRVDFNCDFLVDFSDVLEFAELYDAGC